jgi:hypothetical protein
VRVKSDLQAQLAKAQQQLQQQIHQANKKFKPEEAAAVNSSNHSPQQPSEVSQSLSKSGLGQQSGGGSRSSSPYHHHSQQQAQTAFYSSLLQQLRQQTEPAKGDAQQINNTVKVSIGEFSCQP